MRVFNMTSSSPVPIGKKRQQRENAGIRGALDGQGSKRVMAASEAARHVAEAARRLERRVERSTARERRLADVLAAEVAGYSRLKGADEAGSLTSRLAPPHQRSW
jgi:hypothetical protein